MDHQKTEAKTRQDIIDKRLLKAGWKVDEPSQVTSELDIWVGLPTGVSELQHEHQGHQYADYALLGKDGYPLAIVEAKKTSKDARIGQEQVSITLSQTVDNKQLTDKVSQLSREVGSMPKILDV